MLRSVLSLIFVVVYSKTVSAAIRPPCYTIGGKTCVFPFTWKGSPQNFFECTTFASENDQAWCATSVDSAGEAATFEDCSTINTPAYCNADGRIPPDPIDPPGPPPGACVTDGTRGTDKYAQCLFPFKYGGVTYTECAEWNYGGKQGRRWCSTQTVNGYHDNGKGKYGFCGINCYSSSAPSDQPALGSSAPGSSAPGSSASGSSVPT